jgi:hypothetical protein
MSSGKPHNPTTREAVMAALLDEDLTVAQASELVGRHRNTVDYHLRRAHDELRAHVCGWQRQIGVQGDWAAIYRFGPGIDVPPPKRTKRDEKVYSKRYYRNNRGIVRARRAAKAGKLNPYMQLVAL